MKISKKIRLFRLFNCLSQEYIADLIGLKQKHVAHIESGKRFAEPKVINILSVFFGCSNIWLAKNKGPVVENGWIYIELPSKEVLEMQTALKARQLNKINRTILDLFDQFLKKNKIKKYSVVDVEKGANKFFIFQLSRHSSLVLNSDPDFFSSLDMVIKNNKLNLIQEGMIIKKIAGLISWPSKQSLPFVIQLHDVGGFKKLTKTWGDLDFGSERSIRGRAIYDQHVNKICRQIIANRIKPEDIVKNLSGYCETDTEIAFAKLWKEYLKK